MVSKALLVNIKFKDLIGYPGSKLEFEDLAKSGGMVVVESIDCNLNKNTINPKYFLGEGQLKCIHSIVLANSIDLVIFDRDISASQQKHLEEFLACKVLDRTELILDIFAQRARTFEGKLQVELAQLQHLSTRLVKVWTHLERQRGGVGLRGGPGEKQLEIDRRIIRNRIFKITRKLENIKKQRRLHRASRKKARLYTISLVGYTNSGKSTLFNVLTNSTVTALDLPFATLDPTIRASFIPKVGKVILADTVGFIRDLPHDLIMAFKATLEEINESDLLLHVIDLSNAEWMLQRQNVLDVLAQIGADTIPTLEVYNKIDKLDDVSKLALSQLEHNIATIDADGTTVKDPKDLQDRLTLDWSNTPKVKISALQDWGIDEVKTAISQVLSVESVNFKLCVMPQYSYLRGELGSLGAIMNEKIDPLNGNFLLEIYLNKRSWELLCNKFIDLPKMIVR